MGVVALLFVVGVGTLGWRTSAERGESTAVLSSAASSVADGRAARPKTAAADALPLEPEQRADRDDTDRSVSQRSEKRRTPRPTGKFVVASGTSRLQGDGPTKHFIVEVERGTHVPPAAFARAVERALFDPRSWTADGSVSLQRVDAEPVDFRVTLAHPDTVDEHCRPLETNGVFSCWNGVRTMINLDRWLNATPDFERVRRYRGYVINHEVGHALGHGHVPCPEPGELAPIMMQQTKTVGDCLPNAWPYPNR